MKGLEWIVTALLITFITSCQGNLPVGEETTSSSEPLAQTETQTETNESSSESAGSFVDGAHPTQGKISFREENGVSYLQFDTDFSSDRGPDLFVLLHRSAVPQNYEETEYRNLGKLKNNKGTQEYEIPTDVDLDEFKSVVIWCRQFNVTFGYATL